MFAKSRLLDPTPRFPPMRWREPVLLWAPVAFVLSVGWPILALGSGLGLTLAQTFVQQHHGLIEVDSVPGHTDFKILIPLP